MRAQNAHRKVERLAVHAECGLDRDWLGVHVGDHAKAVATKQVARLLGNVSARVAQAEKGFEIFAAVLGDDFAAVIVMKLVDHHPVIAEHLASKPRRLGAKRR